MADKQSGLFWQNLKLKKENKILRELLEKYGDHHDESCFIRREDGSVGNVICRCGWNEVELKYLHYDREVKL